MDTHLLDSKRGFFRMCVPYQDARKAYCMYVDAGRRPPIVHKDGDTHPNGELFPNSGPGF